MVSIGHVWRIPKVIMSKNLFVVIKCLTSKAKMQKLPTVRPESM